MRPMRRIGASMPDAPAVYRNVVVGTLHAGQFFGFDAHDRFDRGLTFRTIHNWIKDGQIDANLRAFYGALKHGGELGVVGEGTIAASFLGQTDNAAHQLGTSRRAWT
jgi:predicted methyltransferase